jgi:hypothetical protein
MCRSSLRAPDLSNSPRMSPADVPTGPLGTPRTPQHKSGRPSPLPSKILSPFCAGMLLQRGDRIMSTTTLSHVHSAVFVHIWAAEKSGLHTLPCALASTWRQTGTQANRARRTCGCSSGNPLRVTSPVPVSAAKRSARPIDQLAGILIAGETDDVTVSSQSHRASIRHSPSAIRSG